MTTTVTTTLEQAGCERDLGIKEELLQVKNLVTEFRTEGGIVKAVNGVSYHVDTHEIVGMVGESGCGKTVSQLSVLQLIRNPGRIVGGEVWFEGRNLLAYKPNSPEMRAVRGAKIGMIFQEPMTSLNPTMTIGRQLMEGLELHLGMSKREARERAIELLQLVGIPSPESRLEDYPHQFSGGMRQRVMIAIGVSCNPKLVIADEPTTSLDVTTQAQLLELMLKVIEEVKGSLVLVTHNLGVVARYAQRIYIMYAGKIVEEGTCRDIFYRPSHPYTLGLLKSVPRLDESPGRRLVPIEGKPPDLINLPPTCAFLPRCPEAGERCRQEPWPELVEVDGAGHRVRCYMRGKGA
ncbi:MAG: ABC transporter ATP-binding protein [Thermoleophilia bacterium]|nr:ABC transporter ATP-binding protein [Thermoleophilia bacterium]